MRIFLGLLAVLLALAAAMHFLGDSPPVRERQDAPEPRTETAPRDTPAPERDLSLATGPDLTVHGTVTALGRPIAGAVVRLHPLGPRSLHAAQESVDARVRVRPPFVETRTDAAGGFTVRTPRRHRFLVRVDAAGLALASLPVWAPATGDPPALRIDLVRAHALLGRIVGADAADRPVHVVSRNTPYATTRSDATGDFVFENLAPGRYTLQVGSLSIPVRVPHHGRKRVRLAAPDAPARAGVIAGRCLEGAAVVAAVAVPDSGAFAVHAVTDTDAAGNFVFTGLASGRYILVARGEASGGEATVEFAEGERRTGLEVPLLPGGRVEGRIEGPRRAGLEVTLKAGGYYAQMKVDANGRFLAPFVPVATGAVVFQYEEARSAPFDVAAGATVEVVLRRPPRPLVRGHVRGPDGKPFAGATVHQGYPGKAFGYGPGVRTDAEGRFELPFLDPATWDTDVDRSDWVVVASAPGYPPVSRSGLPVPTLATPADVELQLEEGLVFRGIVVQPGGAPAAGAELNIGDLHEATTDAAGAFAVPGFAEGTVHIQATHPSGRLPVARWDWFTIRVADRTARLQLCEVRLIAGRVVDEDGNPVKGVKVSVRTSGRGHVVVETGPDGRFRLEGVPEGEFEVVLKPDTWEVLAMRRTVAGPVRAGRTDLVLTADAGERIDGVVHGPGGPVAGAAVMGGWTEPGGSYGMNHNNYRPLARTRADGSFTLKGLPAGRVDVLVHAEGLLPRREENVSVGGRIDVRLDAGLVLEGRIVRPGGAPRGGLKLKLVARTDAVKRWAERLDELGGSAWAYVTPVPLWETHTDGRGGFRFAGLPAGRFELQLERAMVDVSDPVLPLVVADAGAPQLHIVAPDPLTVAGRVADARGRPVVKYAMRGMRRPVGVTVNAYQGDRKAAWDFVDRDGRFELGGLLPGPVRLEVEAGEEFVPLELQASAGDRDLELALQRKP